MRFSTKFRYWLLRKLACGDMVVLNLNVSEVGQWSRRNAGPALIANVAVEYAGMKHTGILLESNGRSTPCAETVGLRVRTCGTEDMLFDHCTIGLWVPR